MLQVYPETREVYTEGHTTVDDKYISSIYKVVSKDGTSPTSLSTVDAAVLAKIFRKV